MDADRHLEHVSGRIKIASNYFKHDLSGLGLQPFGRFTFHVQRVNVLLDFRDGAVVTSPTLRTCAAYRETEGRSALSARNRLGFI
jgi:hypothetical protein